MFCFLCLGVQYFPKSRICTVFEKSVGISVGHYHCKKHHHHIYIFNVDGIFQNLYIFAGKNILVILRGRYANMARTNLHNPYHAVILNYHCINAYFSFKLSVWDLLKLMVRGVGVFVNEVKIKSGYFFTTTSASAHEYVQWDGVF